MLQVHPQAYELQTFFGPSCRCYCFAASLCVEQDTAEEAGACRAAELAKDQTGDYSKVSVGAKSKCLAQQKPCSSLHSTTTSCMLYTTMRTCYCTV